MIVSYWQEHRAQISIRKNKLWLKCCSKSHYILALHLICKFCSIVSISHAYVTYNSILHKMAMDQHRTTVWSAFFSSRWFNLSIILFYISKIKFSIIVIEIVTMIMICKFNEIMLNIIIFITENRLKPIRDYSQ